MLNYEDCWGTVVPIALLSNLQPPSRATGGSYGLKIFQISIKKFQEAERPEAKEGRGKRQAKSNGKRRQGNKQSTFNKNKGEKATEQRQSREANSRSKDDKTGAKEGTEKRMKSMVGRRIQDKQQKTHLTFVDV